MVVSQLRTPLGYCNEEDIENFLLIDINDNFSGQVNNWISIAEDEINNSLGYTTASGLFNEQMVDELSDSSVIDNTGSLIIYPRKRPINAITGIGMVRGTQSFDVQLMDGDNTRYNIPEPRNKIVFPQGEIQSGGSLIFGGYSRYNTGLTKLSYTAGYEVIPGPINLATVMLVSDQILRHNNKEGLSMIQQGRVTKEYFQRKGGESDLRLDAMELLRPYRMASAWLLR